MVCMSYIIKFDYKKGQERQQEQLVSDAGLIILFDEIDRDCRRLAVGLYGTGDFCLLGERIEQLKQGEKLPGLEVERKLPNTTNPIVQLVLNSSY